ncbi:MAG: MBL fold metallo-hydrolase [Bacilli bacterium]|nr:MBL fold metallo-hydrolase [Bacilli bacterium]
MNIKTVVVGQLQENCYIVEKDDNCIIIDPGDEVEKIISEIDKKVIGILITHHHFDHIGALDELKEKYNVPVNNFDVINFNFDVIETPGHTSDSLTFYFKDEKVMFVGDFIFKDGIGRMDLPTGNINDMKNSLKKIFTYPLDTYIYPGHGSISTLKEEKQIITKYHII